MTRVRRWFFHRLARWLMTFHRVVLIAAGAVGGGPRARRGDDGYEILLTGTFYSENWLAAHIRPLAASQRCSRLYMVSTHPVPHAPKVVPLYPPQWLQRVVGRVPARMILFAWTAVRKRPDIVGGLHLLFNGLGAAVLARLIGARSLYFCVGGPAELLDGGIRAENRLFGKMETPDPIVERQLIRAVGEFDLIVTMGTRAVEFFRGHRVDTEFYVVSGGIDPQQFAPADAPPSTDLILVGRLTQVKRVDLFLRAVQSVASQVPGVTATIVGDGELRGSLERLGRDLGLTERVSFVGHQRNVQEWLRCAGIFVLTSDSEGLALSLMEAMMCGLPAVVSNVGDLGDLVEDGVNGYLVNSRCPEAFASRIVELLRDRTKRTAFSQAAREAAVRYDVGDVARRWDEILGNLEA